MRPRKHLHCPNWGIPPGQPKTFRVYSKDRTNNHRKEQPMTKLVEKRHGLAKGWHRLGLFVSRRTALEGTTRPFYTPCISPFQQDPSVILHWYMGIKHSLQTPLQPNTQKHSQTESRLLCDPRPCGFRSIARIEHPGRMVGSCLGLCTSAHPLPLSRGSAHSFDRSTHLQFQTNSS